MWGEDLKDCMLYTSQDHKKKKTNLQWMNESMGNLFKLKLK